MDTKLKKKQSAAAAALGSKGGKATAKKHGKNYMRELGKKGGRAHWKKEKTA